MTMRRAIEQLYTAFGSVPRPRSIECEPYELSASEVKILVNNPLRELGPEVLRSYFFDAPYAVGTWDDFRYFLPRLLELVPNEDIDLYKMADCLNYAREKEFPVTKAQETALRAFALAIWNEMLDEEHYFTAILLRSRVSSPKNALCRTLILGSK